MDNFYYICNSNLYNQKMEEINIVCKSLIFTFFATTVIMGIIFLLLIIVEKLKEEWKKMREDGYV